LRLLREIERRSYSYRGPLRSRLGSVYVSEGGAIQNGIRLVDHQRFEHGIAIRDVELLPSQLDDIVPDAPTVFDGRARDHSVCSGNKDLHLTEN